MSKLAAELLRGISNGLYLAADFPELASSLRQQEDFFLPLPKKNKIKH